MTTTQIQYQNLLESVFHNRNTEEQARQELSELKQHNRKTEKQTDYSNKSGRMTAQANVKNAKANTKNAETNAKNLKVNQQNAKTNARNAEINAINAATNAKNAETNAKNAAANMLKAQAYKNLTIAQIGKEQANTAKLWKDVSTTDVNLLTKTNNVGKGVAVAIACGNILADPKASPELKAFARGMIAQLKDDSSSSNRVIKSTSQYIERSKKTWSGVQLVYKGGVWMFVPRPNYNKSQQKKTK